jgi:hypothetical protein
LYRFFVSKALPFPQELKIFKLKYFSDMQRTVGCGEQMSKMTILDFENRMGIKDPMHRKKLFLAMCTRQVNLFSSILLGWNDGKCSLKYTYPKTFFCGTK